MCSTLAFQELSLFQEAVAQLKQSVHNELLSSKDGRLSSVDFQRHELYAAAYIQEKCREIFIFSFPLTHALSVSLIMLTPTAKLRTRHLIPDNFAIFFWHKPTQMHPARHTATHQEENAAYSTVWGEKKKIMLVLTKRFPVVEEVLDCGTWGKARAQEQEMYLI